MADKRISDLTAATTPLAGTEVLPIVQSNVTVKVSVDNLTAGKAVSAASLSLTTTPLAVSSGGTGAATFTANGILYGNTTSAISATAAGTTGQILIGNTGSAPSWSALASNAVTSINFGTTGLTPSSATQGAVTVAGTLAATNGGTGQSSYAVGDILYASTTTALSKLADVATGNALISGGVGVAPSWGKIGLTTHVSGTLGTGNGGTGLTSFTANGVVYATSTSALTTGSALGFDGTNLGIGVAPTAGFPLNVQATTARIGLTSTTGTNTVEQRIINTGGTFYIGNDSSGGSLTGTAYAAYLWYSGNYPMIFAVNNGEKMRLSADGNLLLGTNAQPVSGVTARFAVAQSTANYSDVVVNSHATDPYGTYIRYTGASPNGTGNVFLAGVDSGPTTRFAFRSNGGLANYQANDANLSDARVKTDIQPAPSYWDKIKALEVVTFKYVDQTHNDPNIGFIAQQVEQVEPVWVDNDGIGETPEDGVPLKMLYSEDIKNAAIKALQEAMARIEALEAEIAALKN